MPRKILIVDDNVINRTLLKKTLSADYDTIEAGNGKDALALMHREYKVLSAVLLDIVMPEMDGYELLRIVRDNVLLAQIPVIMVTGSEDEESRVKALSLGANDFILKPFNPDIVKHCIKNNIALRETASILNAIQKDKLTGLYNREAFFERVSAAIRDRAPGYYILSCFDIDNFKLINDQYGAAEGDRILREIGKTVLEDMEKLGGIAGRISADNFAALIPYDRRDVSITHFVQQNRMAFFDKQAMVFSVGRYVVMDTSLPASALYDRAFIAKQSVKGRYDEHIAYFDDAMLESLIRGQQIIADVDAAIAEHQFEVWFQPQHNHSTGALVGAEALVRWRHPERGLIPPGDFIPIFEQNGFVYELDKYVWEETCRCLQKWINGGHNPVPVSVNISRYDIFRPDFIDVLTGLVEKYGIPVELLRLEVTESAFAKSTRIIVDIVRQLVEKGFTVEIDDFGSGYSSLNTLKSVPAQVLKLDMRFLEDDDGSGRCGNILESIVRMAKWLGMSVIAEGVEDKTHADYLASVGCSYIQGYLYSRPMPTSEYEAYCREYGKEERLLTMESAVNLDNNSFWEPASMDTLIFNSYVGAACIFEYYNRNIELLRVNTKFTAILGDGTISVEDTLTLNWISCLAPESLETVREVIALSRKTGNEYTREYVFVNIPGAPPKTYLRATMRVIAAAGQRMLIYCTSENVTAQRQAEQINREMAGKLQAVMDNVDCGITAITYVDGVPNYLMINDRYFELLGYTREQYEKVEAFSPIYADDRQQVIDTSMKVYTSGLPSAMEYRAVKIDGSIIRMRVSMTMTSIEGVDAPVQIGMFYDISAQWQASRELLDNMPGGAALYEYDGKNFYIIHVNKRYWELVDRSPIDYAGRSALGSIHPDERNAVRQEVLSAIEQNRDISLNVKLRCGQVGYRPFHVTGRIVPKADGRYSISAIYTPIADKTISIQEMLPIALRAVMNASSEVAYVKGVDLKYISCSRQFASLAGKGSENELIGKTAFDVFPAAFAERYTSDDENILKTGRSLVDLDILFPTKNGSKHLLFSKYPLMDENGSVLGVYGTGRDVTEAHEERSRYEMLTSNIPGGIAVYEGSPDKLDKIKLTYFSDSFCRLFGYTREKYAKLAEHDPLSLVHSDDISIIKDKILALVRNGILLDHVYRAKVNGGGYKWINVKAAMGEPSGENLTVNAVFFDVTEQKNSSEKLRVSEEIYRLALQHSKSVVCTYNVASKQLSVSPSINPIFEVASVEENVPYGSIKSGKVSAETMDAYAAFYESIIRGEKSGEVLFQRMSTIGWRWVEGHFTTIFSDSGEPDTAVLSYIDVTENIEKDLAYKKWRQSLREKKPESYALFHCNINKNTVLDHSEGMLFPPESDADGTNYDERTAAYTSRHVFGEDRERLLAILDRDVQLLRYRHGRKSDVLEYREDIDDGGVRWMRLTVDLMDSPCSSDVEAFLLFENIDAAKRAELEILERAENDPLTGVYNRATFAQKVNKLISESRRGEQHALLMLDIDGFKQVNDVFGHGAGDQTLIEISSLLRNSSRRGDLVGRLGGDEFVIFLSYTPDEASVEKKARQLCEATRKALSVEVQISCSIGIAKYPQDGLDFNALYKKADETLYYVKGIGKNSYAFYHDGMASESPEQHAAEVRSSGVSLSRRKRRMLIVDDSKLDCDLLANMFEDDFNIEKAYDGASALMKLHHFGSAISIVLLDIMMPVMDGFAVLEKIRQSADTASIPVIVVSAAENLETSLRAIRAGAADYVTKPVNPDILRVRVQSAISKTENERLRAQNSFLELQSSEINSYKMALDRIGTFIIIHDWVKSAFIYSPSISQHLSGKFDDRSLWRILLSDLVADSKTVQNMQQLVHDVANDRSRTEGRLLVKLKSASGKKSFYEMNVYKQSNEYGLADKLILAFKEAVPVDDPRPNGANSAS